MLLFWDKVRRPKPDDRINKKQRTEYFRWPLKAAPVNPWVYIYRYYKIEPTEGKKYVRKIYFWTFFLDFRCEITEKGLKLTKKVNKGWKKCFNQVLGSRSTQKLVKIQNNYLKHGQIYCIQQNNPFNIVSDIPYYHYFFIFLFLCTFYNIFILDTDFVPMPA